MAYQAFQFGDFSGGLNLKDKADVVKDSEAIDVLNVEFSETGAIRQRDGFVKYTSSALTNTVDSLGVFYKSDGTRQLLAGCGTRLEALTTSGAVVASATGLTGGPYVFARFAAPASEHAYAANGSDTIRRWDGSAWSAPTGTVNGTAAAALPKAGAICVTPNTNRVVATAYGTGATSGPGGTTSNPSRVHFSNIADPTTWETDGASGRGANFVDLTPGDGEQIMSAVTWRDLVFVFKESKFFVFYSESLASTATPIFNYRAVDTGVGVAGRRAVCVGRDGVYFMNRQGVYFTNGSEPRLLSEKVRPMWTGNPEVYFQSDTINFAQVALTRMVWHDERVYVAVPTGVATANNRVLVYDTQAGWWTLYDLPASSLSSFQRGDQPELTFGYSSGTKDVGRLSSSATDDDGTAITSRWRSGWGDYSIAAAKTIRETKVWGAGSVTVGLSTDFERAARGSEVAEFGVENATWPSSGTWDAWIVLNNGVWPGGGQVNDKLVRLGVRGTVFSTEFANATSSSSWSVHRVTRHMRDVRQPSVL